MPFMVIYRMSDGVPRYEQAGAIDEAALFVERLRNKDGIDQIRIYRMEEISFAFRPYYKVELGTPDRGRSDAHHEVASLGKPPDGSTGPVDGPARQEAPDVLADVPDGVPRVTPVPGPPGEDAESAVASGRQGLFGR